MITLHLTFNEGLLSGLRFVGQGKTETANLLHDFEGVPFVYTPQTISIDGELFKAFDPRADDEFEGGIAVAMNDIEANRLANWLLAHEFVVLDGTEDVIALSESGKPIDVTAERLIDDW